MSGQLLKPQPKPKPSRRTLDQLRGGMKGRRREALLKHNDNRNVGGVWVVLLGLLLTVNF